MRAPDAPARARAVGAMFDAIAHRYDLLNRLMSAGQDVRWRRLAVAALADLPPGPLLDLGVGTGDLALAMRRALPGRDVLGLDLSAGMLRIGRAKLAARGERRVHLVRGDVLRLPFPDAAFAGAATAFTLRNVADLGAALREVRRVLRPGGAFACLEITRPRPGLLAMLFRLYFQRLVPVAGGLISGRPAAYRYLPDSVERFVAGEELTAAMTAAGFREVQMRRFWPGAVTLHTGWR
jgi:demethylmenaquinone methyltransferase/2-methoxy-6-polyprenyl-1,4-benzoquinol methylase